MNALTSFKIEPLEKWVNDLKYPLIISGPCSAESEKQVIALAEALAKLKKVHIFRAGVWKPRTRANSFQGMGDEALKWLKKAKEISGLLTAVEVAHPKHVDACLKNDVDVLWIGARTTVNPFYVQDITNALKGSNIPVLVKNPINPDLELWIGAIERLYNAGINKIIAVHRGFNTYQKTIYRNDPIWDIPMELKRLLPQLPVICDPSHISGHSRYIFDISQKALNLDMCGLMIETHLDPENAITDARQQVTPDTLSLILKNLRFRNENGGMDFQMQLESLRNEIDTIDAELLNLLHKRLKVVEKIGHHKKKHNIAVYQVKRWNSIIRERTKLARELNLDDAFILKMLRLVHDESIAVQHKIMNKK